MRVVFTTYAIASAGICFVLTLSLMICDEFSESFERVVSWIVEFMFMLFGPCLLVFCVMGLAQLPKVASHCEQESNDIGPESRMSLNIVDIFILVVCTMLAAIITFMYALQRTNKLAAESLADDQSVMY